MNPFSKSLLAGAANADLAELVGHWDVLEALVIRVFRGKAATDADALAWRNTRAWLRVAMPRWDAALAPHWAGRKIGGQPATQSPFDDLLVPAEATGFAGNLRAMQTLPAAREALNLLILENQPEKMTPPAEPEGSSFQENQTFIDKLAWIELRDGLILTTRTRRRDTWYLPGGKREPGESNAQALVREAREELGVLIDAASMLPAGVFEAAAHGKPGTIVRMTCYRANASGLPRACSEIAEIGWFSHVERDRCSMVDHLIFDDLLSKGLLRAAI